MEQCELIKKIVMKGYLGKKVLWDQDYGDGKPKDIIKIDSICLKGGFDELNEPVFLNKSKDRYMTLDYVRMFVI